ncbi:hypothetical protein HMPREF3160_00685 [Arthrobacter sp. HMSC06H05]|uniref:hypothetical protein n=1 Tax=Arthrobacter sp. HMSC06H05 TaxID=1581128 RepID=UPI0008A4A7A3|nr:hypothetical protein [Arthrobacter sp. HMSC06H05]OFT44458.1 hypothetical protein HMPREF3160_00685 [Arthrobacter sp. HMSC06H05]
MSFNVVEVDDPDEIRTRVSGLRSRFGDAADAMKTVHARWRPIQGQYVAPEAPTVVEAMKVPEKTVGEFDDAGESIKRVLGDYATNLDGLMQRRRALMDKISNYEAMNPDDDDDAGRDEKESLRKEIEADASVLAQDKDDVQNRCRDSLLAINIDGKSAKNAQDKAPQAHEANGGADSNFFQQTLNEFTGANDLEGVAGGITQSVAFGLSRTENALTFAGVKYTTLQVRNNWAPGWLQWIAKSSKLGERLVKWTTGWEPALLVRVGRRTASSFIKGKHPGNIARKPESFRDFLRLLVGRTIYGVSEVKNRKANKYQAKRKAKLITASKWVGRSSVLLAGGVNFASSWQEDSRKYPSMGNVEKGLRAGATAGATAGGAALGAKGGAALGAAIGSFGGPVGTAAGAVIGGVVGGVVGGNVGSWVGDRFKEGMDWFKNLF